MKLASDNQGAIVTNDQRFTIGQCSQAIDKLGQW